MVVLSLLHLLYIYLFIFKETNPVPKSSPTDSTAHSIWKASKGNILKVLQFDIKKKIKEEKEKKEHSLCFSQDWLVLAVLLLCMLIQSSERKLRPDSSSQQFPMLPDITWPTAGTVWGQGGWWHGGSGMGVLVWSHHQLTTILLACSHSFLSILHYWCNAGNNLQVACEMLWARFISL